MDRAEADKLRDYDSQHIVNAHWRYVGYIEHFPAENVFNKLSYDPSTAETTQQ